MNVEQIGMEIYRQGVKRGAVASALGMSFGHFTRILNGERTPPPGFAEDCAEAIAVLIGAEAAGKAARDEYMAAHPIGRGNHESNQG